MKYRRAFAAHTLRVLFLVTLLLCGAGLAPRGSAGGGHGVGRAPLSAPAAGSARRDADDLPPTQTDGEGLIAFSADERVHVMNADGTDVRRVLDAPASASDRHPALSPDGSRLAFVRADIVAGGQTLYVVQTDGTGLRAVVSGQSPLGEPAWSPDGSRVAFVRGYDPTDGGYANLTTCPPEVNIVDVESGAEVSLTQGLGGTDPAWSPDGTRVAFSSTRDGNYEIYAADVYGADVKRLTQTSAAEAEPAWSPDGKLIAYEAHLRQDEFGCGFMPTVRPSGPGPVAGWTGVYVVSSDGTDQGGPSVAAGGMEPTWSPDSTRLALVINAKGGRQIYVASADGLTLSKLTWDSTQKSSPSWSPGRRR